MNKYIFRVILFLVPIVLCIIGYEAWARKMGNEYKYKNEWLTNNASSVQVLVLGASQTYYGIDPIIFHKKTFNAAHVSQTSQYDNFIFNTFFNDLDSLEFVIIPVAYPFISTKLEDTPEEFRVKNYIIYYSYPAHKFNLKYHLESCWGINRELIRHAIIRDNWINCTEYGMGTDYSLKERDINWTLSGSIAAARHTYKNYERAANEDILAWIELSHNYLGEIFQKCYERSIPVIMLTTPTFHTYWENLDQEQLTMMYKFCNQLVAEFPNVTYLDMLKDKRFADDDFFDADHLNEYGAAKLSTILDNYIENHIKQTNYL